MCVPYERRQILLQTEQVRLTLAGQTVLRDINLCVRNIVRPGMQQGQVIGFLGPSGLGKTQLFRILAGLQAPSSGQVYVSEARQPVARGMVGMVSQQYLLFEHYTVLRNLQVAARQSGVSDKEARDKALAMLARFQLERFCQHYPAQLSGGQRQRVAIAQQLLCSSHFLLLDEPFSGLDPLMADTVCELIHELAHSDELNTIILITHDIAIAVRLCDTLWLLGRERDAQGQVLPGATIRASYDLIERGLAWQADITQQAAYADCLAELRGAFATL